MATVFKTFLNNDITSTRTLLHEAIPLTGSIVSGTYGTNTTTLGNEPHIKNYAHGMFQSIYDYPYLSSSANHIFDITFGYSAKSALSASISVQNEKKINIYNQMAAVLSGYDETGSIRRFDEDGNQTDGGTKMNECIFLNFSRLLNKDEIKKGSFSLQVGTGSFTGSFNEITHPSQAALVTISDSGKENDYRVNSPAGEYSILSATAGYGSQHTYAPACGLIYYQAGIVVLSGSLFVSSSGGSGDGGKGILGKNNLQFGDPALGTSTNVTNFPAILSGTSISGSSNFLRHRIKNISFNNTTELNSTIHFCRANHNDFNYSSNPTYVSESKIRLKNNSLDAPVSYITSVGLYSADNELLAVAKLSEPLKKDPTNEMTLRVRLDY